MHGALTITAVPAFLVSSFSDELPTSDSESENSLERPMTLRGTFSDVESKSPLSKEVMDRETSVDFSVTKDR